MSAQPPIPPSTPHILRIPGEIRNQIYENLLLLPHSLRIYRQRQRPTNDFDATLFSLTSTFLPLFLTCRQIHLEASALFYSQNKFTLPRYAPHQSQVNVLFRFFLDRLGPRNAALLRRLTLPFPVDSERLFHFYNAASASVGRGHFGENGSLVPQLRERCPELETVEFDLRSDGHSLRMRGANPATMRAVLRGGLEEALWEAFPRLKYVDLRLPGGVVRKRRGDGECEVITGTSCREEEDWGGDDNPALIPHWRSRWYPANARHPQYLLYTPPAKALRSDIHDSWATGDLVEDYVRFAGAWLRSPRTAMREWEDSRDWREWKRTMIAQAGPVGAPLYCSGASSVSAVPARSRRGVFGLLGSRR